MRPKVRKMQPVPRDYKQGDKTAQRSGFYTSCVQCKVSQSRCLVREGSVACIHCSMHDANRCFFEDYSQQAVEREWANPLLRRLWALDTKALDILKHCRQCDFDDYGTVISWTRRRLQIRETDLVVTDKWTMEDKVATMESLFNNMPGSSGLDRKFGNDLRSRVACDLVEKMESRLERLQRIYDDVVPRLQELGHDLGTQDLSIPAIGDDILQQSLENGDHEDTSSEIQVLTPVSDANPYDANTTEQSLENESLTMVAKPDLPCNLHRSYEPNSPPSKPPPSPTSTHCLKWSSINSS